MIGKILKSFGSFPKEEKKIKVVSEIYDKTEKQFIIIGPPASGKTVFYISAVDRLMRLANENRNSKFSLIFSDIKTQEFVDDNIRYLSTGQWPSKNIKSNKYTTIIIQKKFMRNIKNIISFFDFPGEVFTQAFLTRELQKDKNSAFIEDANLLKKSIEDAKGLFLFLDSKSLYEGVSSELRDIMFNLFEFLTNLRNKKGKLAIIFSKRDIMADNPQFSPEARFKELYPDAWRKFSLISTKYYYLASVGDTRTDNEGNIIPAKNHKTSHSINLLDPISWMFDLNIKDLTK